MSSYRGEQASYHHPIVAYYLVMSVGRSFGYSYLRCGVIYCAYFVLKVCEANLNHHVKDCQLGRWKRHSLHVVLS
jgi:hypothetical protein